MRMILMATVVVGILFMAIGLLVIVTKKWDIADSRASLARNQAESSKMIDEPATPQRAEKLESLRQSAEICQELLIDEEHYYNVGIAVFVVGLICCLAGGVTLFIRRRKPVI